MLSWRFKYDIAIGRVIQCIFVWCYISKFWFSVRICLRWKLFSWILIKYYLWQLLIFIFWLYLKHSLDQLWIPKCHQYNFWSLRSISAKFQTDLSRFCKLFWIWVLKIEWMKCFSIELWPIKCDVQQLKFESTGFHSSRRWNSIDKTFFLQYNHLEFLNPKFQAINS